MSGAPRAMDTIYVWQAERRARTVLDDLRQAAAQVASGLSLYTMSCRVKLLQCPSTAGSFSVDESNEDESEGQAAKHTAK